jgi:ABC-type transport system involved in multi-copper enzyme maturation permease subunit
VTAWLVAWEFFKRSFSPRMLVVLAVVGILFLIVAGCLFGAQLYSGGRVYGAEEQLAVARGASYHIAVAWGILFAVMLAMGAASRPLEDGRAQFLLSKPVRRSHVLLGQLFGVFLAALVAAAALAALASALSLVRAHVFPWTLWFGLGVASLAFALVVALAAFFSLLLPRVVAGMLGIIFYVASFPAAFSTVRDFMTGGHGAAGLKFPWYVRWGAEVYFAAVPPIAGVQLRAGELLKMHRWDVDGWLTVATAAAYVVVSFVATWALYARRDV